MAAGILDPSKVVSKQSQTPKTILIPIKTKSAMLNGILMQQFPDPDKFYQVVRCCIEHAAVVAKSFLTSDVVIVEAKEGKPVRIRPPMPPKSLIPPMPASGNYHTFIQDTSFSTGISCLLNFAACFSASGIRVQDTSLPQH